MTEQAGDRGLGLLPGMIGFLAGPSAAAALADPLRPLALIPKYAETMATTGAEIAPITATAPLMLWLKTASAAPSKPTSTSRPAATA